MSENQEGSAAEKPAARIVSGKPRSRTVTLEYPVEFDGKTYTEITVHRLSGVEVRALVEAAAAGHNEASRMLDCPTEVYEALDDDDLLEVDRAVADFLPRRFRLAADAVLDGGEKSSA